MNSSTDPNNPQPTPGNPSPGPDRPHTPPETPPPNEPPGVPAPSPDPVPEKEPIQIPPETPPEVPSEPAALPRHQEEHSRQTLLTRIEKLVYQVLLDAGIQSQNVGHEAAGSPRKVPGIPTGRAETMAAVGHFVEHGPASGEPCSRCVHQLPRLLRLSSWSMGPVRRVPSPCCRLRQRDSGGRSSSHRPQ